MTGGRNHTGKITVYHRGGGLKRTYRVIDFWRRFNQKGVVLKVHSDINRNCNIALVLYLNGFLSYILAAETIQPGSWLTSGSSWMTNANQDIWPINIRDNQPTGSTVLLGLCPLGTVICNIELKPGFGGQLCRAAGTSAVIVKKENFSGAVFVTIKIKSGWSLRLSANCMATLGIMSNIQYKFFNKQRAGFVRNLGRRPIVRGVAMNPVDHPHGGGEGKSSGGKLPKTPWGLPTKGRKTVSKNNRKRINWLRFKQ